MQKALNKAQASCFNKAGDLTLRKAHVLNLNSKIWLMFGADTKKTTKGSAEGRLLFVGSELVQILLLRRKRCALLTAKSSSSLCRKTCAMLRARTCADMGFVQSQYIGNHKEENPKAARPPLWWRPKAAASVLALNKTHLRALNTTPRDPLKGALC